MKILSAVEKKQCNFWNHCTFGPTDAVEDPWGKRILDQMLKDGAVKTIRIYTMFEDIVYLDENNELQYDFRLSDLRLDYLLERGYDLLLTYAGMPDCIADNEFEKSSVTKNKTRYKGKMWNTSPPKDIKLWEEICYEYTKHNERYGIEQVSKWCTQCFNEPDHRLFFMRGYPNEVDADVKVRCAGYCAMYKAFVRGVRRVSSRILVGGPVLAGNVVFLGYFLDFVREQNIDLDFISLHNYGTSPRALNEGTGFSIFATNASNVGFPVELVLRTETQTIRIISNKVMIDNELIHLKGNDKIYGKKNYGSGHKSLIEDFYDCVQHCRPFPINGTEGAKSIRVISKAYRSKDQA